VTMMENVIALFVVFCTAMAIDQAWQSSNMAFERAMREQAVVAVTKQVEELLLAHQSKVSGVDVFHGLSCTVVAVLEVQNDGDIWDVQVSSGSITEESFSLVTG